MRVGYRLVGDPMGQLHRDAAPYAHGQPVCNVQTGLLTMVPRTGWDPSLSIACPQCWGPWEVEQRIREQIAAGCLGYGVLPYGARYRLRVDDDHWRFPSPEEHAAIFALVAMGDAVHQPHGNHGHVALVRDAER